MAAAQEKFTGQAVPELLSAMRGIAQREGRDFEEVLEEAMWDYFKSKLPQNVRPEFMMRDAVLCHFEDEKAPQTIRVMGPQDDVALSGIDLCPPECGKQSV